METLLGFQTIPTDEYHRQDDLPGPALSYSIAKLLVNQSPRHAFHAHPKLGGGGLEASDEMDYGTVAHTIILGNGNKLAVGEFDDWRKKEAREFRDFARAEGMTPVLRCKLEAIEEIARKFETQVRTSDARSFYAEGTESELAARWELDGILCQSLFDRVNLTTGEIFDVKNTTSAHPKKIAAKIVDMGYDIQAEFYRLALETLMPELAGRTRFIFLFLETAPPFSVTPVEISGLWRAVGQSKVERALTLWSECLNTGSWPGYSAGEILDLDPPKWAYDEELAINY